MVDKPIDLIEKYLERVKVYLPLGSEDTLTEIRTHLIQMAEELGNGQVTHGSAMLAIERFGDPKDAANAYSGTGRKIGPVRAEYATPLLRIALLLVVLSTVFIVGASILSFVLPDILGFVNFPFSIPVMIVMSLIYAFLILGGLSYLDKDKAPTEKTVVESILGVGSGAFKPKPLSDAAGDFLFGMVGAVVLMSPQVQMLFTPEALLFIYPAVILMLADAIKGVLFLLAGENNVNLLVEAIVGVFWIVLSMFLINITFPLTGVWNNTNGIWEIIPISELSTLVPEFDFAMTFDLIWIGVVFLIVITNLWEVLVASMKIPMYLSAGKGWWWKGEHGKKKWRKYRSAKTSSERHPNSAGPSAPNY